MNENADLIRDIERFADRHSLSETGVSRLLARNPNFLDRLRKGCTVYRRTEKRIREKIIEHDTQKGELA